MAEPDATAGADIQSFDCGLVVATSRPMKANAIASSVALLFLALGCAKPRPETPSAPVPAAVGLKSATVIKHVDASGAQRLLEERKVVVLDVRTPAEYAAGHIAGATNIDFRASDFEQKVAGLDKAQPYLVHCAAGGRSTQSLAVFDRLGFKRLSIWTAA